MNQFTFLGREKSVLIGLMILGAVCLALSYFAEPSTIKVMVSPDVAAKMALADHGHGHDSHGEETHSGESTHGAEPHDTHGHDDHAAEGGHEADAQGEELVEVVRHTHHQRFWSNFLQNAVYFLGMSFTAFFAYCAFISAYGGWFSGMKRLWEAYALYMIIGLVMMIILIAGVWGHWHHLYHWNVHGVADPLDEGNFDKIIAGKSSFLNKYWYTFATIICVAAWYFIVRKVRSLSIKEDSVEPGEYKFHNKARYWMAAFLPIGAFTSAVLIWQWMMSVDAHWYSTMYAWNATASFFCGMLSITILILIYLKSRGYYPHITENHMHDIGKYLFGFSVFWTYTWFSQYMLIWYSNNGEETVYFLTRRDQYPILFYGNLVLNFALPFLILVRNSSKRKFGTIGLVAAITFFGHWFDIFYMIKPGSLINIAGTQEAADGLGSVTGYWFPGLLELGIFLGFTALFVYFVFSKLTEAPLVPEKDPYYGESVTHHVI